MISKPENRAKLKLAAACLDTVADSLADVKCTIDGRLATFENTSEQWSTHPELPNSQLRRLAAPAGAPYQMLEVRSPAGTSSIECTISHATDVHVLAGQILINRPGRPEEYYTAGTCTRFVANERHTCQVLQDSHRLVIFHLPPNTPLPHVK